MSIRIRTNMASLVAQRNVGRSGTEFFRSIERLSSGLRINSARDDSAGLSIATRFQAQIRGLGQAIRNASDAISLTQVAEGSLQEASNLVIRVRELAVQAANDTQTDSDRENIQEEVTALIREVSRIADGTTFNDLQVINGGLVSRDIHVGPDSGDSVRLFLADARSAQLGRQVRTDGAAVSGTALAFGDLTLNQVAIRASAAVDDTVSSSGNASSAIAKAGAINSASAHTGVRAIVNATVLEGDAVPAGGALDAVNLISINGESIVGITVEAADAGQALVGAINALADTTGVIASLTDASRLRLDAADGRNIVVETTSVNAAQTTGLNNGAATTTTTRGSLTLQSERNVTLQINVGAAAAAIGFGAGAETILFGLDGANALKTVDVRTREGANRAIDIADVALRQVTAARGRIGAFQNRLESATTTLSTMSENVIAARSRITDVDFAAETARFARNNVLRSAGVAILAQANVSSDLALNLLSS